MPVRDHAGRRVRGYSRGAGLEPMAWARSECATRSIGVRDLLLHLRDRIDRQVLDDPER
jgi:hypothetical protein